MNLKLLKTKGLNLKLSVSKQAKIHCSGTSLEYCEIPSSHNLQR
jgi:hypothetical protein